MLGGCSRRCFVDCGHTGRKATFILVSNFAFLGCEKKSTDTVALLSDMRQHMTDCPIWQQRRSRNHLIGETTQSL
jgi:hypothetical protein